MRGRTRKPLTSGTARRIYQLYEGGAEVAALVEAFETSTATVTRLIRGQVWTEATGGRNISRADRHIAERKAYIQGRWDQGCRAPGALAAELGISRQAVHKFMRKHKLGPHEPKKEIA